MKKLLIKTFISGVAIFTIASCTDDLDLEPYYEVTSATVYNDFDNYKLILAKLYAGFAVSGQQGPAGKPDITGFDEGKSNYLRALWHLQELSTDEAVVGWNDGTLLDIHEMDWTASDEYVRFMYDRIYYQIALTNEFIRETTEAKVSGRGFEGSEAEEVKNYHAEARFLRAISYWHALDMFGNVPFVTEEDGVGSFFPEQISRQDLFTYVEAELLAIEGSLMDPRQNEYARADKAAAWTLLTKLYLNAEVYINQPMYTEAITYAKKVIDAGYTLEEDYSHLFLADNHNANGVIFPIAFDGLKTKSYGGTTYLIHAPVGGDMNPADFGINGGWAGLRTTEAIVSLFNDISGDTDERAMFFTEGQELEINNIANFTDGYPITKFRNVSSDGVVGSDPAGDFTDTDFPMFRLADVYLMYAEAVLRGGSGGDIGTALLYINDLRERAFGDESGNIAANEMTLDFILDERARELSWETHRRTDLIRFGKFTSGEYLWPWKGGVKEGTAVEPTRRLFPIPSTDIIANPNLEQNEGY